MTLRRLIILLWLGLALPGGPARAADAPAALWQGWLEVRAHAGPGCTHEPTPPYRRPVQLLALADTTAAPPSWLVLGPMEPVRLVPQGDTLALQAAEDGRRTLGRVVAATGAMPAAGRPFTAHWAEHADAVDGACAFAQAELHVTPQPSADAAPLSHAPALLALWVAQASQSPEAAWPAAAVAEALAHFEALAQPGVPSVGLGGLASDLAERLWASRRRTEAAPLLAVAAALYARDGELALRHRALALARLGELLGSLRRGPAAEATYREALALAASRGDGRLVARLNNQLGTLLLRSGRADEAGLAFEQAVAGERRGGDVLDLAAALNNLGQSQERSGQPARARRSYVDALAVVAGAGEEGAGLAAILRAHLERLDASRGPAVRPLSLGA